MPAYDYRCTSCDTVFEIVRAAGSEAVVCCPQCSSDATKRVFTPVGVVFKGSGFHNTDYRTKPTAAPAETAPCAAAGDKAGCATCPAAGTASASDKDGS